MSKHVKAGKLLSWYLGKTGFVAITMPWKKVYYRDGVPSVGSRLYKHESEHLRQMDDEGSMKFLVKYLWYSTRYGYQNNPYEIEARASEMRM